jgi:hypothetical protein
MTTAQKITALETMALQNRNGWIPIECLVLVRTGTAKEDGTPLRALFEHESAARTQPDSFAPRARILVIAHHPDSLQSIDHV